MVKLLKKYQTWFQNRTLYSIPAVTVLRIRTLNIPNIRIRIQYKIWLRIRNRMQPKIWIRFHIKLFLSLLNCEMKLLIRKKIPLVVCQTANKYNLKLQLNDGVKRLVRPLRGQRYRVRSHHLPYWPRWVPRNNMISCSPKTALVTGVRLLLIVNSPDVSTWDKTTDFLCVNHADPNHSVADLVQSDADPDPQSKNDADCALMLKKLRSHEFFLN